MSDFHHGKDTPIQAMWMSLTGASAHLHEEVPGIEAKSIAVGHEADEFNLRGIIYVPIAVVVALVVTYVVVTGIFAYVNDRVAEQKDLPSFNDRISRYSSSQPIAQSPEKPGVPQPRPEFMEQKNFTRSGETVPDPSFLRSFSDNNSGNNPQRIYPETLRSENFVDPTTNKKVLAEYDWVVKDKVAQIPLADAVKQLLKNKLPTVKDAKPAPVTSLGKAKLSTGGRGGPSDPKKEAKHDEHDH